MNKKRTLKQEEEIKRRSSNIEEYNRVRDSYKLDTTDEKIIQINLEYPGIHIDTLATLLDIPKKEIRDRLKKPSVARAMADLQKGTIALITEIQTAALRRLRRLIASPDERIATSVAKFVLQPIFNTANIAITNVSEKRYVVQFGEGGQMFTDTKIISGEDKKLTTLELLKQSDEDEI